MLPSGFRVLKHSTGLLHFVRSRMYTVSKVSICSVQVRSGAASAGDGVKGRLHMQQVCQRRISEAATVRQAGAGAGREIWEEVPLAAPARKLQEQVFPSPCGAPTRTPGVCLPPHRRTPACSCRVAAPGKFARKLCGGKQSRVAVMYDRTAQCSTKGVSAGFIWQSRQNPLSADGAREMQGCDTCAA